MIPDVPDVLLERIGVTGVFELVVLFCFFKNLLNSLFACSISFSFPFFRIVSLSCTKLGLWLLYCIVSFLFIVLVIIFPLEDYTRSLRSDESQFVRKISLLIEHLILFILFP